MMSPDVSPRGSALFLTSVLAWIGCLSYWLRFLFGAEISVGWFSVGVICSLMAVGFIMILKEILVGIDDLRPKGGMPSSPDAKAWHPAKFKRRCRVAAARSVARRASNQAYRVALGLKPRISAANHRRSKLHAA